MRGLRFSAALAAALAAAAAQAAEFRAGFARADITPPLGVDMAGYYVERKAKSVLDPLELNCVALSDGSNTALVVQIDACYFSNAYADRLRQAASDASGVGRDFILLHCSHTHTSANLSSSGLGGKEALGEVDWAYQRFVATRVADVAVAAVRDLRPARLSCGRSEARRISFGRRYLMKDGRVRTNPGTNNPDIVGPAGNPPDEQVQVLRIDRDGALPICVISFQTHPDVVGGEGISADWPGLTRAVFEAATFGRSHCLVLNGTQGDLNHCNVRPLPGELNGLRRDFDDVDRGYDHARHMANALAAAALSVWMKCAPLEAGEIRARTAEVRVPAHRAKTQAEVDRAREVDALYRAGRANELPWKGMDLTTELARAKRILRLKDGPDAFKLPLYAVSVGRDLVFLGFPGEPFNDIGKAVKAKSPFRLTLLSCITNSSNGYFPFSDCYEGAGSYESATSSFGPSVADDLVAGAESLLSTLRP